METTERRISIDDVHQLVKQLSEMLQKTIVLENSQFELISYHLHEESAFDPVQQKTIIAKRCPLYVIERLKKEGVLASIQKASCPVHVSRIEDIDFYERVAISLTYVDELCGYLWINEGEKALQEHELEIIKGIVPHLATILYMKEIYTDSNPQQTIWKLMNDEFVSDVEIHRATKMTSFYIPEEFNVMVGSIKDPKYTNVLEKVRAIFEEEHIAYYLGKGTEIIGIIDGYHQLSSDENATLIIKKIQGSLTSEEKNVFLLGIGNTYHSLHHLRQSYLEALEVIETMSLLNKKQRTIFMNHQLGMFRYVQSIYNKHVREQYRNPTIKLLMKKDAENNSELIKTLWNYLKNDCKVGETAAQLFIHPNTLNYRLKQIVELTNINLSDMQEKTELYIQLLILNYVPDYEAFYKKVIY